MADGSETMTRALARYFEDNGFGEDGGYGDAWVDFKVGGIPFPFPNTPMRVRAVKYHDLHHLITGYRTDLAGEMEIGAWEIGAGCRGYAVAWQLNLASLAFGTSFVPRRTFRAFVRGRRSRSLYDLDYAGLMAQTVGEVRRRVGVPEGDPPATASDVLLYALALAAGLVVGSLTFLLTLVTLPFAYLAFAKKARAARASRAANAVPAPVVSGSPTPPRSGV